MKRTAFDTPLNEGKMSPPRWVAEEKGKKPPRTHPNRRGLKPSDTHQMTWAQLCTTTGKCHSSFWYQVNRYNMTPLEALKHRGPRYNHVVMSLKDICERVGIRYHTFDLRRRKGKSFREALLTPVNTSQSRRGPRKCKSKKSTSNE